MKWSIPLTPGFNDQSFLQHTQSRHVTSNAPSGTRGEATVVVSLTRRGAMQHGTALAVVVQSSQVAWLGSLNAFPLVFSYAKLQRGTETSGSAL